jgi:cytochrome c-type biogenesis protein CcmE|tara:strand:- start:743 stop:1183 length:441 start_codon:yes stop_codon:yes gene_type:complete
MRDSVKKRFYKFIIGALLILLSIFIIIFNLKDNLVYFYSPTDLKNMPININQSIRVGGLVEKDSVGFNRENMKHTFIITDNENTVKVEFKGILPNLFAEEKGVVVEGKQKNINTISAQQVLAKHDENYMPPEVIKILQDDGRWQGE